ncbi:MAG: T9SS type A sorting domain-containing protein [Bacteroidota bacterium]
MKKQLFFIALLFVIWTSASFAQPSQGGFPPSFKYGFLPAVFDMQSLQAPDMEQVKKEDGNNEKNGELRKVARSVHAGFTTDNAGTWTDLPDGGRVWRLGIQIDGALALGVCYDGFFIPPGAQLFLYNNDKTQLLGAYTWQNNPTNSGLFANELISGDRVNIEYYEPARVRGKSIISISELAYVYRDFSFRKGAKDFGQSESCEVNINCPEGTNWQDEKTGVARVFLKVGNTWGWCSGTLINNCRNDCTPYFLTADHCGEGSSAADMNQWVFHFNYEASGCTNPSTEPTSQTITGATLKANGGNGGNDGSDFYLLQLNTAPTFNPYYNGWDRNNTAPASGVGIHHPAGDIKKISTYTSAATSASWGGTVQNTHWQLVWAATTSGHGVTEGGSSGSPLFNSSGLVVGDLTGGSSYCSSPNDPDMYGKFYYSWDQNGTTPATRLKDWLDPDNTGATTLQGHYCSGGPTFTANFTANTTNIPVGGTVDFTDLTSGTPTGWTWAFNGGTPATSTTQNPTGIQYNVAGLYTVSLTATDGTNTDNETKPNYITVGNTQPVDGICDTMRFPIPGILVLYSVRYLSGAYGYISGTNGYSDKAKADYFVPAAQYTKLTGAWLQFGKARKRSSIDDDVIFCAWPNTGLGNSPGSVPLGTDTLKLSQLVNEANSHNMTYISFNPPVDISSPFFLGVILPGQPGDTLALLTNKTGQSNPCTAWEQWQNGLWYSYADSSSWGYYLSHAIFPIVCQPNYGVEDLSDNAGVSVFPNPSNGNFTVGFEQMMYNKAEVIVYNVLGAEVKRVTYQGAPTNNINIDLGNQPLGLYYLNITTPERSLTRTVSIIR